MPIEAVRTPEDRFSRLPDFTESQVLVQKRRDVVARAALEAFQGR